MSVLNGSVGMQYVMRITQMMYTNVHMWVFILVHKKQKRVCAETGYTLTLCVFGEDREGAGRPDGAARFLLSELDDSWTAWGVPEWRPAKHTCCTYKHCETLPHTHLFLFTHVDSYANSNMPSFKHFRKNKPTQSDGCTQYTLQWDTFIKALFMCNQEQWCYWNYSLIESFCPAKCLSSHSCPSISSLSLCFSLVTNHDSPVSLFP